MIKDVIAEPYREKLLPGFAKARNYAASAGALATAFRAVVRLCLACAKNKQWLNVWHVGLSKTMCKMKKDSSTFVV